MKDNINVFRLYLHFFTFFSLHGHELGMASKKFLRQKGKKQPCFYSGDNKKGQKLSPTKSLACLPHLQQVGDSNCAHSSSSSCQISFGSLTEKSVPTFKAKCVLPNMGCPHHFKSQELQVGANGLTHFHDFQVHLAGSSQLSSASCLRSLPKCQSYTLQAQAE